MNEPIVFEQRQDLFATSETIAEFAQVSYRSVQRLIEKHMDDLNEFSRVRFEITPFETKGGIQDKKIYHLNEQQTTLLITYLKNTPPVREFKKQLVKEFFKMRKLILERQSAEWQQTRSQGKLTRKSETDTIQKLIEYAKVQGSQNADKMYMTYSKLINGLVGIKKGERETAPQKVLDTVRWLEDVVLHTIEEEMNKGTRYKEIYQVCKRDGENVMRFAYLEVV